MIVTITIITAIIITLIIVAPQGEIAPHHHDPCPSSLSQGCHLSQPHHHSNCHPPSIFLLHQHHHHHLQEIPYHLQRMEFGAEIDGTEDFFQVMDSHHDNYHDCYRIIALIRSKDIVSIENLQITLLRKIGKNFSSCSIFRCSGRQFCHIVSMRRAPSGR